ncbi:biotin/lipoyl-binding protein [Magnetospira thiophila]
MVKHFRIAVDGHEYDVTVEDLSDPGNLYPSPGMISSNFDTPPAPPPPVAAAPTANAGPDAKLSPLAGVVSAIEVTLGQTVAAGDRVCTIEAMKMKTAVTAHKSGKITEISVAAGDAVDAGQPLVTIS